MTDLHVRRHEAGDADAVRTLHEWAMGETDTDPGDVPGTEDLDSVEASYLDAGGEFLVGVLDGDPATATPAGADRRPPAVADGTLVAMGGVLPSAAGHDEERRVEGAAALHRMRVAPTHQGRGYGRAILDALEAAARERGFDVVLATTARTQPRAVAFYPAAGYDLVGESTAAGYELVHYEKRLGD
jgi:GNAT superfamily N-acetyltransferase